jgi:hypothetical protein
MAAPPPAPGKAVGAPHFIGIGSQKAGTTWWHDLVSQHPAVETPVLKELHFFSRYCTEPFGEAEISKYYTWFTHSPGTIAGEWTPDYVYLPWVPRLVAAAAPDARLILILRDPVERLRSGLAHNEVHFGRYWSPSMADTVAQGFYATLLGRWLKYFSNDQLLVLQHEQNVRDPAGQLSRTYRFLGIEDSFVPEGLNEIRNAGVVRRSRLAPSVLERLVELYASEVGQITKMVPDLDLDLWTNFSGASEISGVR